MCKSIKICVQFLTWSKNVLIYATYMTAKLILNYLYKNAIQCNICDNLFCCLYLFRSLWLIFSRHTLKENILKISHVLYTALCSPLRSLLIEAQKLTYQVSKRMGRLARKVSVLKCLLCKTWKDIFKIFLFVSCVASVH